MVNAKIIGTGSYLPKNRLTNFDLYSKIQGFGIEAERERSRGRGIEVDNLTEEQVFNNWVLRVCGVNTRYFVEDETTEFMAQEASSKAIEMSQIDHKDIDLVILTTFTPTKDIPNSAAELSYRLNLRQGTPAFPINTACAGFVYGLSVANSLIKSGDYRTVLVASSESISKVIDFTTPNTAILFGDGAGSAVLQATEEDRGVKAFYLGSDYDGKRISLDGILTPGPRKIKMDGGEQVLKDAAEAMVLSTRKVLEKSNTRLEDIDLVIPHQGNKRITHRFARRLNLGEGKVCDVINNYANTSAATIPIALDKLIRNEIKAMKIEEGNMVILTAIGGGYSYGAALVQF